MALAYRFKFPLTVVVQQAEHTRLLQLPAGSIFLAKCSTPDVHGMVQGTCKGETVMLFALDLDERAELVGEEKTFRARA